MADLLTQLVDFTPTRKAGSERLEAYAPFAGSTYRNERNFDYGPANRSNVSVLSPWVRHRLITEQEIASRVMQDFALSSAEKFIQEVFWRTYWKGWLEMRPSVWDRYVDARDDALSSKRDANYNAAIAGQTGIDCFDAWVKELIQTGYLHNHARMWFASIWIFTLKLNWTLGADFFLRHLMDADAASNTLSWRWVAGIQTKGKNYNARASNIHKFTNGRFDPKGLYENAAPLDDDGPFDPPVPPALPQPLPSGKKAMLLIHEHDCVPEQLQFGSNEIACIAIWNLSKERSPLDIGAVAASFTKHALADAASRAATHFDAPYTTHDDKSAIDEILAQAIKANVECIFAPFTPQGWTRGLVLQLASKLSAANITFHEIHRDWDSRAWPYATKGFFAFKEKIPKLLLSADLEAKRER